MKKTAAIIAVACAASFAYGQGTILMDNLIGAKLTPIYLPGGTDPVKGADYKAALLFGGSQVGNTLPFDNNGRFKDTVPIVLTGVKEGGTATGLLLNVWDSKTGADYAGATLKGQSAPFDNGTGGGTTPPLKLVGLQSFSLAGTGPATPGTPGPTTPGTQPGVIPEPSTIALGLLGAAGLFFRFRK
jgi:hypothetical protein